MDRWSDIDRLLTVAGPLAPAEFTPMVELKDMLMSSDVKVLVVGAGGLGCEILKDLALSGFTNIHVIDLDTIDITNLNRQFLFRHKDVGKYKSEVAANFIMERVPGCKVTPYTTKIQQFDRDFYSQFIIFIAGLDNVEARRWLNSMVHSLVEFDQNGNPNPATQRVLIDGGTEGFRGQARVVIPYKTACYECTLSSLPPQISYPLCTIAETPRLPEHCIQYAYIIMWEKEFGNKKVDKDSAQDMTWIYERAKERADSYGIEGVTYNKTMGVVKNIIAAIASTNALVSAACCNEAFKVATGCCTSIDNYFMFMGQNGVYTNTIQYQREETCLVCSRVPITMDLQASMKLQDWLDSLKENQKFKFKNPSVSTSTGKNLYFIRPAQIEEATRPNLQKTFEQLISEGLVKAEDEFYITDIAISENVKFKISIKQ